MRKSRINLVVSRQDYQKYEYYFSLLKKLVFIFLGLFLLLFTVFFLNIFSRQKQFDNLSGQKESLLQSFKQKSNDEVRIYYLQKKYEDLNNYLKEDAFSAPYYNLLTTALKESTQSSSLKTFDINKKHEFSFVILFEDFPELMNFFKFAESKVFLKNFKNISLKSFSVIGGDSNKKENYELSFMGEFNPIKQNILENVQP